MKALLLNEEGLLTEPGQDSPNEEIVIEVFNSAVDSMLALGLSDYLKETLQESIEPEYLESDWVEQDEFSYDDINNALSTALSQKYPISSGNGNYTNSVGSSSRYTVKKLWMDKAIICKLSYYARENDQEYLKIDFVATRDDANKVTIEITDESPVSLVYVDAEDVPEDALLASVDKVVTSTMESLVDFEDDDNLREDVDSQDLVESFDFPLQEAVIEEHGNKTVIKNVVVLGEKSVNGRSYPPETQLAAIKLFEGAKAYLNHPAKDSTGSRDFRDIIGRHRGIRHQNNKIYSDLHLINNDDVKGTVLPAIRFDPSLVGNSIVAKGKLNATSGIVEAITSVRSIDLVCEPATTKGLLESVEYGHLKQRPLTAKVKEEIIKEERGMEIKEAKDLQKDAVLYEDVRKMFVDEFKKESEYKALQESVDKEKKRADTAEAELLKVKVEKEESEKRSQIDSIIAEAKIPDSTKSDKLRQTLYGRSVDDAKMYITTLEESVAEAMKASGVKPALKAVTKNPEKVIKSGSVDNHTNLSESQHMQAFAAFTKH